LISITAWTVNAGKGSALWSGESDVADMLQIALFVHGWDNMSLEYNPMPGIAEDKMTIGLGGKAKVRGR
jgi:hypothetical protein